MRRLEDGRLADGRHVQPAGRGEGGATGQRDLRRRQGGRLVHDHGDPAGRRAGEVVQPVRAVDRGLRRQRLGRAQALLRQVEHGGYVGGVGIIAKHALHQQAVRRVIAGHDAGAGVGAIDPLHLGIDRRRRRDQREDQASGVGASETQWRGARADVTDLGIRAAGDPERKQRGVWVRVRDRQRQPADRHIEAVGSEQEGRARVAGAGRAGHLPDVDRVGDRDIGAGDERKLPVDHAQRVERRVVDPRRGDADRQRVRPQRGVARFHAREGESVAVGHDDLRRVVGAGCDALESAIGESAAGEAERHRQRRGDQRGRWLVAHPNLAPGHRRGDLRHQHGVDESGIADVAGIRLVGGEIPGEVALVDFQHPAARACEVVAGGDGGVRDDVGCPGRRRVVLEKHIRDNYLAPRGRRVAVGRRARVANTHKAGIVDPDALAAIGFGAGRGHDAGIRPEFVVRLPGGRLDEDAGQIAQRPVVRALQRLVAAATGRAEFEPFAGHAEGSQAVGVDRAGLVAIHLDEAANRRAVGGEREAGIGAAADRPRRSAGVRDLEPARGARGRRGRRERGIDADGVAGNAANGDLRAERQRSRAAGEGDHPDLRAVDVDLAALRGVDRQVAPGGAGGARQAVARVLVDGQLETVGIDGISARARCGNTPDSGGADIAQRGICSKGVGGHLRGYNFIPDRYGGRSNN